MDFVGFLSIVIYVVSLSYTQCLRYNICSAWFVDIRISTCFKTIVISLIVHYRGWVGGWVGGGGVGVEGGWEAGGGLNPPLGLFGLAMGPRSASHRPKHA